ncbi:sodium:proton antiporter [Acidaminobacter sp. JC074]|uniref:Na+/H+ antiporter NhaC family protein n=1 Tax=Acidaminobacter sp. JC074 TaxID=2530199 RepID=UPI001F0DD192|nr:Na+/H+ antiporter NhaC family protein [Acidaminobacter sp. JC074]MCH4887161.1 sodium:proton antiporter [Acidaminobacter sp. JC074]
MLIIVILCIASCVVLDISLFWGFLAAILILTASIKDKKIAYKTALEGVKTCKSLYLIILLLGANISIWMSSGIIPTTIYFGFDKIAGVNFLAFSFVCTAILSTVMGTGLGTLSTVGLALYGIGKGFGLPEPILLGAIVSGAFISDKISPVSALTNLTIEVTSIDYKRYFKAAIGPLLITCLITGLIYYILGSSLTTAVDTSVLTGYQETLFENYKITPLLFLIPLAIIVMALSGINVLKNMLAIFTTGSLITIFYQKISVSLWFKSVIFGYKANTGQPFIDSILKAGGILPMVEVLLIVTAAIVLNGLLTHQKTLNPIFDRILAGTKTKTSLVFKTGIISMFLTSITCDQTIGIVVPGNILKDKYDEMNLKHEVLARTIADTGTIIAPLEFWNVNSLIILGITGISALQYAPFAILCYLSPIITILYTSIRTRKE